MAFLKKIEHPEHTEDADYTKRPYGCVYAKRYDAQHIDNAKEAEDVFLWAGMAVDSKRKLKDEEHLDNILHNLKKYVEQRILTLIHEAVYHDKQHAECDHHDENNIKELSHRRVRTEDYRVDLVLQRLVLP